MNILSFLAIAIFKNSFVCAGNIRGKALSSAVIQLEGEDYFDLLDGKAVFLKFSEAGCVACQDSAPVWEELANSFFDNENIVIAEIECGQSNSLCVENDIDSYPTFKYGDGDTMTETYKGSFDLDGLKSFVSSNVRLECSIENEYWCNPEELALIKSLRKKSVRELEAMISAMELAEEGEFDKVEEKLEAAEEIVEIKSESLQTAEAGGINTQIEFARKELTKAEESVADIEMEFDTLMEKDEPLDLKLMEELIDELDLEMVA